MFKPLHIMLDKAPGRAHYSELDDQANLIGKGHGNSMTLRSGVADMVCSSPCPFIMLGKAPGEPIRVS
jgi:hypothetical protein